MKKQTKYKKQNFNNLHKIKYIKCSFLLKLYEIFQKTKLKNYHSKKPNLFKK